MVCFPVKLAHFCIAAVPSTLLLNLVFKAKWVPGYSSSQIKCGKYFIVSINTNCVAN